MDPRSILVYVTSDVDNALGENVLKLPLLLALDQAFPMARIAWVPGTSGAFYLRDQLAPLVGGRIDEFITDLAIPTDPRAAIFAKHPILDRHFDLIIDTQRYFGRTLFLRRIPHGRFISGTWRYALSNARPPRPLKRRPPRLIDKLLGLAAAAAGHPIAVPNPITVPQAWRARAAVLLPTGPCYVGLSPGAGNQGTGKCWPLDSFVAVARAQVERGRVPVFLLGWEADFPDPSNFLTVLLHSRSRDTNNNTFYASPEVDRVLDAAEPLLDLPRRFALFHQAEVLIVRDAPWVPLFHPAGSAVRHPRVRGYELHPLRPSRVERVWLAW